MRFSLAGAGVGVIALPAVQAAAFGVAPEIRAATDAAAAAVATCLAFDDALPPLRRVLEPGRPCCWASPSPLKQFPCT